jgi:starvation-inducible DNA-binding protein
MITRNAIGIDAARAGELAYSLNTLLANYAVFYQNVRGFHWNIRGEKFFELHVKFEELYADLQLKIDEIAERILTLGGAPLHTFTGFTEHATVHAVAHVSDGRSALMNILDSLKVVIEIQRSLLTLSSDADDEGTNALMSDYIRAQEKLIWMYSAYLG